MWVVGGILSTFIGVCLYHQAFSKYIQSLIDQLNNENRRLGQKELLIDIIQFHNSAKDMFLQSADVFSIYILILLICYMILLITSIFQLDLVSFPKKTILFISFIQI